MEQKDVIRSLSALAHPIRLQVFRALVVAGKNGMTPGTMAEGLAIPPNTLSFHLKELGHAGLVSQQRASRNIIYRAAFDHMNARARLSHRELLPGGGVLGHGLGGVVLLNQKRKDHEAISRSRSR